MGFLDDDAPWGSPVDASIPLPPFADAEQHARYVRMLQLHLALLDGGAPTLSTIALSLLIEPPQRMPPGFAPSRRRTDGEGPRGLTPTELAVSLTSWFPAPWTVSALADSLQTLRDAPTLLSGGTWRWMGDPIFEATSSPQGGWTITCWERGQRETASVADDRDLVVLWMAHFREKFVYPLVRHLDPADVKGLAPASVAVLDADERDAAYQYRKSWRAERDAALAAARREE